MKPGPLKGKCTTCSTELSLWPFQLMRKWNFCSYACRSKAVHTGRKNTEATKLKMRVARLANPTALRGEDNASWKGDQVGYSGVHTWISKEHGKASACAFCGKTDGNFQWANISHQYLRDRGDWEQLCVPCHKRFDLDYVRNIKVCQHV